MAGWGQGKNTLPAGNDGSGHTSSGSDDNAAPDRAGKRLKTTRQSKRLTAEEKALRSERRKEVHPRPGTFG